MQQESFMDTVKMIYYVYHTSSLHAPSKIVATKRKMIDAVDDEATSLVADDF
jgi:hypothetical protein